MTKTAKQILLGTVSFGAIAAVFVSCSQPKPLTHNTEAWNDPSSHNSDRFDLTNWKITIPVPDDKGKALEVKKLAGYESEYFYDAKDGAMVFWVPVDGPTTKNSKYPRSELRERDGGEDAAWNPGEGGTMTATLKIEKVPTDEKGNPGKIVIGQIHGEDDELVRLYWDNGVVYFKNDQSGDDDKEHLFELHDASGQQPKVSLNEVFSYKIDARGEQLAVTVYAQGREYTSVSAINSVWQSDKLYFKAGAYLGNNVKQGASGVGKVAFYRLDFSHTPGQGLGGLR